MTVSSDPERFPSRLRDALATVVSIRSTIPDDAFTAEVLGTERSGYGVVIRPSGLILTIGYLTAEAETIWVTMSDGTAYPGHVLSYDFETGFGLVQILQRVELQAIEIGSSDRVAIGDTLIVAGHGNDDSTVVARVVARQEFAGYWEYWIDDALFTAPAHQHWGGTAVINTQGELVGIGSLLVQGGSSEDEDDTEDINMVVPIDILKPRLDDLVKFGRPKSDPRPWLGLYATEISDHVVIMGVASYGPAADAGLEQGDVVMAVDGEEVADLGDFFRRVWTLGPAGTVIPLQINRGGNVVAVSVKSADRTTFLKAPMTH